MIQKTAGRVDVNKIWQQVNLEAPTALKEILIALDQAAHKGVGIVKPTMQLL